MRAVNVPMRAVLSLPFPAPHGGRLMLVYVTGRKTDRRYRQPLSCVPPTHTVAARTCRNTRTVSQLTASIVLLPGHHGLAAWP
jgi:hypothetical protein